MENLLMVLGYVGMIVSVVGTHYQSKLDMKTAFKWFIAADCLLIGIQVYLRVWPQAILLIVFLYMSIKGLRKINER